MREPRSPEKHQKIHTQASEKYHVGHIYQFQLFLTICSILTFGDLTKTEAGARSCSAFIFKIMASKGETTEQAFGCDNTKLLGNDTTQTQNKMTRPFQTF